MSQAAGSTPDPGAPDRGNPTSAEAAEALTAAAAAERAAQMQTLRVPAWLYPGLGLCIGGIVASNAIDPSWVAAVVTLVIALAIGLILGAWMRTWQRDGVQPRFSWKSTPREQRAGAVVTVVVLGIVFAIGFLVSHRRPEWALATGAIVFVAYSAVALGSQAWSLRQAKTADR